MPKIQKAISSRSKEKTTNIFAGTTERIITLFDVCADDHCQRYQGITIVTRPEVREAIVATRGQILTYSDEICDARSRNVVEE